MSDEGFDEGEILELDPPKVYAFRWTDEVLRFELLPDPAGCLLVFTATQSGIGTHGDLPSTARQASGWDVCLANLLARLDDTDADVTGDTWFDLAERYVEAFGLAVGTVEDTADGYVVRFERDLVQPIEQVWATLTTAEDPLTPGSPPPVQLTHAYVDTGAVTEVEPPNVVTYECTHDGAPAGRVRFDCRVQQPIGTRLVVTHTLPRSQRELRATLLAAWQTHLELLFAALHGEVRCPWPTDRTEALRTAYEKQLPGPAAP